MGLFSFFNKYANNIISDEEVKMAQIESKLIWTENMFSFMQERLAKLESRIDKAQLVVSDIKNNLDNHLRKNKNDKHKR